MIFIYAVLWEEIVAGETTKTLFTENFVCSVIVYILKIGDHQFVVMCNFYKMTWATPFFTPNQVTADFSQFQIS